MEEKRSKLAFILFIEYLKIGAFTFGGGLSMIPLIEKAFVEKRKYITSDELLDIIGISEATPGVIAVNSATYIGYKVAGFLGSVLSTIGVCLPSLLIILLISFFYDKFIDIKLINYLISGLMVGVTYLILRAGIKVYKNLKKNYLSYILMSFSFIMILLNKFIDLGFSSILIVLIGGAASLIVFIIEELINKKKNKKEEEK